MEVKDYFVLRVTTIIRTTAGSWDRLASFRTGHPRSSEYVKEIHGNNSNNVISFNMAYVLFIY